MTDERAKPTGNYANIDLTGMLIPMWKTGAPVMIEITSEGSDLFVVAYSSKELLVSATEGRIMYDKISQIIDGPEFLSSVPNKFNGQRLRVAVDMRRVNGKTRFYEIARD